MPNARVNVELGQSFASCERVTSMVKRDLLTTPSTLTLSSPAAAAA